MSPNLTFGPYAQLRDITRACEEMSTEDTEIYAEVRSVAGKPIVILRPEPRPEGLEALVGRGCTLPLSRSAQ